MANAITTELQVVTNGANKAIAELNSVGSASRRLGQDADIGGDKFSKLSKTFGKVGGAGRIEFTALAGLVEAIGGAEKSWKGFMSSIGQTAVFAGAAVGIGLILDKSKDLSAQIDKIYEDMGKPAPGFWGNLGQGWKIQLGRESDKPQSSGPITKEEQTAARQAGLGAETTRFIKAWKTESTPESQLGEWVGKNKEYLEKMGIHEREAAEREKYNQLKTADDSKKIKDQEGAEVSAFWKSLERQIKEETAMGKPGSATAFMEAYQKGTIADNGTADLVVTAKVFAETFKNTTGALTDIKEKARLSRLEGKPDLESELVLSGRYKGPVKDQEAMARRDADAARETAREQVESANRWRKDAIDAIQNPQFASGDVTQGSAAAYSAIARFGAQSEGDTELKRLQKEQTQAVKDSKVAIVRLAAKSLSIVTIS